MSFLNTIKSANNMECFYREASPISGWLKNHNITDYKSVNDEVYGSFKVNISGKI